MTKQPIVTSLVLALSQVLACSSTIDDPSLASQQPPTPAAPTHAVPATDDPATSLPAQRTLLASLSAPEAEHTVDIFEMPSGTVAVRETHRIGQKPLVTDAQRLSLSELYRTLSVNGSAVPESILAAEQRVNELRQHPPVDSAMVPAEQASEQLATNPALLAWDWSGDATWFLGIFCHGGVTWCPTNVGWAWAQRNASSVRSSCMAAGFDSNARYIGRYYQCNVWDRITGNCRWETEWDEPVVSRYIRSYTVYGGDRYVNCSGDEPNPRIHLAVVTN